ncbi:MAG: NAD(P)-dependent oxidoreductase [Rhodovibrionaceae bacterium]|nr:NAD(P)-dependent oxidoreductase [Rhodovibrionaceae bacterium]
MSTRIAFIGTGIMGAPMARNLLLAGHEVTAWNRTAEKARPLERDGGKLADSPAAAAEGAQAVFTMLSDGPAVTEVLDSAGVAAALSPGAIVIDCSSIPPSTARDHAERLADRGLGHLDAPVSGGPSGAEQASLAIMVGGSDEDFAKGRPLLEALGRPTHVGPAGAGQLAKLANQTIVGLAIGAVAEALLLAGEGGADPAKVREAMRGGFADSLILQIHGERMIERSFLPGGPASMHLKDMRTVMEEAQNLGLDLPLAARATELFEKLVEHRGPGVDHSGLLLEIERLNPSHRLGEKDDTLP